MKKNKNFVNKRQSKKRIDHLGIIYNIKSKDIYDTSIKKVNKRKNENISDEESDNNKEINKNIIPSFHTIKSSVSKYISKKFSKDFDNLSQQQNKVNII